MTGHTLCDSTDPALCTRTLHDHRGQRETAQNFGMPEPDSDFLVCGDCDRPMHYDYGDERYHHNDPTAPACHMIDVEP